jgi:L-fuconolactonase
MIDAHQHFIDPDHGQYPWIGGAYEPLRRVYRPADLRKTLEGTGVERTIAVQARTEPAETEMLLRIAATEPWVAGVVGWADLTDPAVADALAALRARPDGEHLVGIRHPTHDEPDPDWLARPDVGRGLAAVADVGLVFDLLVRAREMPVALDVVRVNPGLTFVIDHLAKPPIASGDLEPWEALIRPFGASDNVAVKLSGLVTEADWVSWRPADLAPYVDVALDVFGPDRLMFGSDWPVCLMAGTYHQVVAGLLESLGDLAPSELTAILGGTAARVYRLP